MKRLTKILVMGVALIMSVGLFSGCGDNKPTEQAQSGAYFATGNGREFAVILDDKISLYWDVNNNRFDVFQFSLDKNSYVGENVRSEISFKVFGDNLTITLKSPHIGFNGSKKFKFKRDDFIMLSEEESIRLNLPDISLSRHPALETYTNLNWSYDVENKSSLSFRQNGYLGAILEYKHFESESFTSKIIIDCIPEPACFFDIPFKHLNLMEGYNILRIRHVGGPFVDADNKIRLSTDSEAISFNVTVDLDGNIILIEKI